MNNKWFEVFAAGTHTAADGTEHSYTEADLDKIVANYSPAKHEAPIVVGHPKDNAPAFGWIAGLRRVGNKLEAQAKDVMPEFAEMVKNRQFSKRSVSLYPDMSLRHVGFLGAMPPSVKGLKDIAFAASDKCTTIEYAEDKMPEGKADETKEAIKEAGDAAKAAAEAAKSITPEEAAALKARVADLETLVATLKQTTEKAAAESAEKEAESYCEALIVQGKLLPAQKADAIKLLKAAKVTNFSEAATIRTLLSSLPAQVDFSEFATGGNAGGIQMPSKFRGLPVDADRAAMYLKAKEYMAEDKALSFEQAIDKARGGF